MRPATEKKHEFIREMLGAEPKATNGELVDAIKKKFGSGIAPNVITEIRKSMGIKAVRGYHAHARSVNKTAGKPGAKKRGRPAGSKKAAKIKRGRGRPKKSAKNVSGVPSHILLIGGNLVTCSSRSEAEEKARKALLSGNMPEVYSRSEKPFEFVVKLH